MGVGGVGNRRGSVESGGGDGGADGGGARWRDCCRFSDEIFRELREDLPYRLPSRSILLISLISFRKLACREEVV